MSVLIGFNMIAFAITLLITFVMAWDGGSTSKAAYGDYTRWKYCELVEERG